MRKSNITQNKIRAALMTKNHSVRSWSQANSYKQETVQSAIHRWVGAIGNPRGKTKQILHDLEHTIGRQIYTRPSKQPVQTTV